MAEAKTASMQPWLVGVVGLVIGLFFGMLLADVPGKMVQGAFTYTSQGLTNRAEECQRLGGSWGATGPSGSGPFDGGECQQGSTTTTFDRNGFVR